MLILASLGLQGCGIGSWFESDPVLEPHKTPPKENTETTISQPSKVEWRCQKALDSAHDYIIESQKADGSWGHYLPKLPQYDSWRDMHPITYHAWGSATTALNCLALHGLPSSTVIDSAMRRGVVFLLDSSIAMRFDGGHFYNVWAHSYIIHALADLSSDSRLSDLKVRILERLKKEIQALYELQGLNAGWGYYDFRHSMFPPSGSSSTSFTTSTALIALKHAKDAGVQVDQRRCDIALDFLESQRQPNATYIYSFGHHYRRSSSINRVPGSLSRTQAGDHALSVWRENISEDTFLKNYQLFFRHRGFLEIGRARQYPHEAWYAIAGYFFYYGHFYASLNLGLIPSPERERMAMKLAEAVAETQGDDGAFWDFPILGYSKPYGTGFAAATLANCKKWIVSTEQ